MDYRYIKSQSIALPLTEEPLTSEKQPLVDPELSAQPPVLRPKKSKFKKSLIILSHLFLITVVVHWLAHKAVKHHHDDFHHGPHHKLPVVRHLALYTNTS